MPTQTRERSLQLKDYSSEALIAEVVNRIKRAVAQYPSILAASKGFSEEGGYQSPIAADRLSQQQLQRFTANGYKVVYSRLLALGTAADKILDM